MAKTVRRSVAVRKGARGEVCHPRGSELCTVRRSRPGRPRIGSRCCALPRDQRDGDVALLVFPFARRWRPTCAVRRAGELCAVRRWAQGVLGPVVFDTAPTMAGVQ